MQHCTVGGSRAQPIVQPGGPVVLCWQVKYYFLWKLAESASVFSGFDFSGWTQDGKPIWGRCTNVRFLGMWLSDSASIVPSHWNIRTGGCGALTRFGQCIERRIVVSVQLYGNLL